MKLNSGNDSYHSVQNLLSSCLLSKHSKIRMYTNISLPVVLYGCETLSLTLKGKKIEAVPEHGAENSWTKAG
jgi:hypothetical protein